MGHAALALDLPQLALSVIKKVLDALFVQEERLVCCPSIYARALILAAKGHLRLGELRLAEGATADLEGNTQNPTTYVTQISSDLVIARSRVAWRNTAQHKTTEDTQS